MENDSLTLVSEKRLRELLKMEKELIAARLVVDVAKYDRDNNIVLLTAGMSIALNKYDQVVGESEK